MAHYMNYCRNQALFLGLPASASSGRLAQLVKCARISEAVSALPHQPHGIVMPRGRPPHPGWPVGAPGPRFGFGVLCFIGSISPPAQAKAGKSGQ